MPADLNRVTIVGRLTRDPEVKTTKTGGRVANLRLASSSRGKAAGGDWEDRSNYFDVIVWDKLADTAEKFLNKGRRIGIDGRLVWREWEAKDGSKRQTVEILASDLHFLDSSPPNTVSAPQATIPALTDDDIPF